MENMTLYNLGRAVPDYAKKPIAAGRLKGMTDISPMWRIEKLTEIFGACGIGWWYEITSQRLEKGEGNEVKAFVDINLYYTYEGQTSKPIPGTGGSSFISQERNGTYTSDECYKMALTDAISVAAKALGIGANVYMGGDRSKYPTNSTAVSEAPASPPPPVIEPPVAPDGYYYCVDCHQIITGQQKRNGEKMSPKEIAILGMKRHKACLCADCTTKRG